MKAHSWLTPWGGLGALMLTWSMAAPLFAQNTGPETPARALPVGAPIKPASVEVVQAAPCAGGCASASSASPRFHRPLWTRLLFWNWREPKQTETVVASTMIPSPAELARIESGQASLVEAAATKIKADEAAVPARRAAIQYLLTVRCHHYPEAEAALIAALRADRNELVRYEAAQALAQGCCSTPKTVEALQLALNGSENDGNPAETSDRVKAAALYALQRAARLGVPALAPPDMLPPVARQQPAAPPSMLQLTSFTLLQTRPAPGSEITEAELRFAQTAGIRPDPKAAPAEPSAQPAPSATTLPALRVAPIGQLPTHGGL
jgi:hypothetical protein